MSDSKQTLEEQAVAQKGNTDILSTQQVHFERLPLLEVVLNQFTQKLALNSLSSADIALSKLSTKRFGEFMKSVSSPSMIGIVEVNEWRSKCLFVLDRELVFLLVCNLLGSETIENIEERPYTLIECDLIESVLQKVISDLALSFSVVMPLTMKFNRIETNPQLALITQDNDSTIVAQFSITLSQRTGCIHLILPYSTLEPARDILLENYKGEQSGSIWEEHLREQVCSADLELDVVFKEHTLPLSEVLNWKPGSELHLKTCAQDPIMLRCRNHIIGYGKMGQKAGNVAIRLEDFTQKKDTVI